MAPIRCRLWVMLSPNRSTGTIVGVSTPCGETSGAGGWAVIIPVKTLVVAKSRLIPPAGIDREILALAMAADVIAAAMTCSQVGCVAVVTNDATATALASRLGAAIIRDVPDSGQNAALAYAAELLGWHRIAALSSDLPGMTPADLGRALTAVPAGTRAVVADSAGSGTVLLAANMTALRPQFGVGSLARHRAEGAQDLTQIFPADSGLRQDVDTAADLAAALRIGVGTHTRDALANHQPSDNGE